MRRILLVITLALSVGFGHVLFVSCWVQAHITLIGVMECSLEEEMWARRKRDKGEDERGRGDNIGQSIMGSSKELSL